MRLSQSSRICELQVQCPEKEEFSLVSTSELHAHTNTGSHTHSHQRELGERAGRTGLDGMSGRMLRLGQE